MSNLFFDITLTGYLKLNNSRVFVGVKIKIYIFDK